MAKPKAKKRWRHPDRKFCFCFKRPESPYIYTSVYSKREVTDLIWKESNKEEAMEILEYRINAHFSPDIKTDKCVNDIFVDFASIYYRNYTKSQRQRYNNALKLLITENHNCQNIELIRADINKQLSKMEVKKYSPTHIHKMLSCIKRVLEFGVEEEYLTRNPVKKAMFPIGGRGARQLFFNEEEINRLIEYSEQKRGQEFADLLRFLSVFGVRINEPLMGKRQDINLKENQILIRDTKRANKSRGEMFTPRYLDLDIFGSYYEVIPLIERILERDNGDSYFRWNYYGRLGKWLRTDMMALGIYKKNRSFHSFRKYAINQFINKGFPISVGSHIFGHDENIMKKHYLEIMGAKKFKEFIENSLKKANDYPIEAQ